MLSHLFPKSYRCSWEQSWWVLCNRSQCLMPSVDPLLFSLLCSHTLGSFQFPSFYCLFCLPSHKAMFLPVFPVFIEEELQRTLALSAVTLWEKSNSVLLHHQYLTFTSLLGQVLRNPACLSLPSSTSSREANRYRVPWTAMSCLENLQSPFQAWSFSFQLSEICSLMPNFHSCVRLEHHSTIPSH